MGVTRLWSIIPRILQDPERCLLLRPVLYGRYWENRWPGWTRIFCRHIRRIFRLIFQDEAAQKTIRPYSRVLPGPRRTFWPACRSEGRFSIASPGKDRIVQYEQ